MIKNYSRFVCFLCMFTLLTCNVFGDERNTDFLSFTAASDGSSVTLSKSGNPHDITLRYSSDKVSWTKYEIGDTISLSNNAAVYFSACEGGNTYFSKDEGNFYYFSFEGVIDGGGNIMSLLDSTCTRSDVPTLGFNQLFGYSKPFEPTLHKAPLLPATMLGDSCYYLMFWNCSFKETPELPALTLTRGCYEQMFSGCELLERATPLPATSLAENCYREMFSGCSALTSAPNLPATSLAKNCYRSMFFDCISLSNAPQLPATELADSCYYSMFNGCSALQTAPELPATKLKNGCYINMFRSCTQLNYLKVHFTTWIYDELTVYPLSNWLNEVSEQGVFIATATSLTADSIPTGWTFKNVPHCILYDTIDPSDKLNEVVGKYQQDQTYYIPDIYLHRTFTQNGKLTTLNLPFTINLNQLDKSNSLFKQILSQVSIERFVKDTIIKDTLFLITQTITTKIERGTPYFIKWKDEGEQIDSVIFKNIPIQPFQMSIQGKYCSVDGSFAPRTLKNDANSRYAFVDDISDNPIIVTDSVNIKGFRCYIKLSSNISHVSQIKICHEEQLPVVQDDEEEGEGGEEGDPHSSLLSNSTDKNNAQTQKVLINGNIYIYKNGGIYTLDGQLSTNL